MKKTIRMGDLRDIDGVADHLRDIVEWKNLLIEGGYHHEPIDAEKCSPGFAPTASRCSRISATRRNI